MKNMILIAVLLLISGCYEKFSDAAEPLTIEEFKNFQFEEFKNWSIYPRDDLTYIFKNQVFDESESNTMSFFMIRKRGSDTLYMDVLDKKENNFVTYTELNDPSKKRLSQKMVKDFFGLGVEKLLYREVGNNEYIFFEEKKNNYWYFFKHDTVSPPFFFDDLIKIDSNLYTNTLSPSGSSE